MIIFGTRGSRQSEILTEHTCSACGKEQSIFAVPFQRYFHIFWIPIFPTGSETVIVCSECGATFVPEKYPLSIEVRNQIKTPKWTFAGLIIFGTLITITLIAGAMGTKEENKNTALRVESPEKGDIYELKHDKKDYRMIKVASITTDSVFFFPHMYSVEKEYQLKKLREKHKNDYYEDAEDIVGYSKKDIQEMVNDKTICTILRD